MGTPAYLAPEQIDGSLGPVGGETDIFALGGVIYRALTGRPAFEAAHVAEMLDAVLHAPQPAAPSGLVGELTTDVDAVIGLALAKRPADRYSSARAFVGDLRAAHEGRLGEEPRERARQLAQSSSPGRRR